MPPSPFSPDALRGFPRPVYAVAGGQLVNLFGSGLVYPFATVHFHLTVGISLAVVGFGLLANNVATAVGTAIGGYLADRRGRKPVMVASMVLSSVTLAAYALVRTGPEFVAVAAAAGLTLGLYTPASHATVADLTEGGDRDRAFALLKVGNNAGFGAGFVVGGVLYEAAKLSVFVLDGLTCLVVAGVLWYALPRLHEGDATAALRDAVGDWGRALSERRVLTLAVLNVGFAVMYAQMQATVPVVAEETLGLTSSQLGTLYVLNPLVIVCFQLPLVAAVSGWRRTRGLAVSASLWAASMLAVAAVGSVSVTLGVALVGAFLVLRTLGEILHAPLITSLVSSVGRAEERGSQLSFLEVAKRLGFGLGSVVGGAFFDAGLQSLLWPTLAGVCGLLGVGVLLLERRVTPAENGAGAEAS